MTQFDGNQSGNHADTSIKGQIEPESIPEFQNPTPQRLKLSVQLVNQLLNERSHRPDAVRLLREIIRERAISHPIKAWDAGNLFG